MSGARGSVLVVVLWTSVLLGIGAISVLHATTIDVRVAGNHGDRVQARWLALAGVEKAKAVLYREETRRRESRSPFDASVFSSPSDFREQKLGRGKYDVIRGPAGDELDSKYYGVIDLERFVDLNVAGAEELGKIPGLTPAMVGALVDWRDSDSTVSANGAEAAYYDGLEFPRRIANAPFESLLDVLRVRGIDVVSFFGEDANGNGLLDPSENDGDKSAPLDNADGVLELGVSRWVTIGTGAANLNVSGDARADVRSADASELALVDGLSGDLAQSIADYRQAQSISSIVDLLDVKRVEQVENRGSSRSSNARGRNRGRGNSSSGNNASGNNASGNSSNNSGWRTVGSNLIDQSTLIGFADGVTGRSADLRGVVNVNTASAVVLATLPGVTEAIAQAIVERRQTDGWYRNEAELLEVDGIDKNKLKTLIPRIVIRSGTFRVIAEGRVDRSNAVRRVEVIVRRGLDGFETLSYREDL